MTCGEIRTRREKFLTQASKQSRKPAYFSRLRDLARGASAARENSLLRQKRALIRDDALRVKSSGSLCALRGSSFANFAVKGF